MMRKSGILLPLTSLPSPCGVGAMGREAYDFVDFLAQAGQSLWQILPVGHTGSGDSPYQCFSAFAGSPYTIDLHVLAGRGLLEADEIGEDWGGEPARVDYGRLFEKRLGVLAKAAARQNRSAPEYREFCRKNAHWIEAYALFMALKEAHGYADFTEWPEPLRRCDARAVAAARAQYAPRVEFWRCVQFFWHGQFMALKRYANAQGVEIVGDIPIYVSGDSCDLWAAPDLFRVDAQARPTAVAGVPPDAFSADGQLWGNPLYDWKRHRRTRYAWWIARLRQASELFDITRIDHFRGFADYYAIPAGEPTAKNGRWEKGPGMDFIRAVRRALPDMRIIAEDLGFLTKDVAALLKASGYPGMKILQFAFDSREESDYLPHNYPRNTVVYTGTHDNTTCEGWKREAAPEDLRFALSYLGISRRQPFARGMIRAAMGSVADTAVIPMQDWLGLPAEARINRPATVGGDNWRWRLTPGQLSAELAAEILELTRTYGRASQERQRRARAAAGMEKPAENTGKIAEK